MFKKLNMKGVSHHILLPILAVLVVAGIGGYVMQRSSSAATKTGWTSLGVSTAGHNDSNASKYVVYQFKVKVCKIAAANNTYKLKFNEQIIVATNPSPTTDLLRLDAKDKSNSNKKIASIDLSSTSAYSDSYKPGSLTFKSTSAMPANHKVYVKPYVKNSNNTKSSVAKLVSDILTCK